MEQLCFWCKFYEILAGKKEPELSFSFTALCPVCPRWFRLTKNVRKGWTNMIIELDSRIIDDETWGVICLGLLALRVTENI